MQFIITWVHTSAEFGKYYQLRIVILTLLTKLPLNSKIINSFTLFHNC